MKNSRKIIAGLLVAAGLATAGAIAYAQTGGYGPGWGGHHYDMTGPGMMGGGRGHGGFGPGMMGGGRGHGGFGPGMAGAGAGPAAHIDGRLAYWKAELKITPAQESAWQAYAKQAKQQAESMQTMRTQAQTTTAQSAPERLSQRAEFAKQRAAGMGAISTALKDLYAALTPEQKTIADQYFGGGHMSRFSPRGYRR